MTNFQSQIIVVINSEQKQITKKLLKSFVSHISFLYVHFKISLFPLTIIQAHNFTDSAKFPFLGTVLKVYFSQRQLPKHRNTKLRHYKIEYLCVMLSICCVVIIFVLCIIVFQNLDLKDEVRMMMKQKCYSYCSLFLSPLKFNVRQFYYYVIFYFPANFNSETSQNFTELTLFTNKRKHFSSITTCQTFSYHEKNNNDTTQKHRCKRVTITTL